MRIATLVSAGALCLSACASMVGTPVTLTSTYNPADYEWSRGAGQNKVVGSAALRTVGGEVRSCGGAEVLLVPEGEYSRERIVWLYGNTDQGYKPVPTILNIGVTFENDDPRFESVARRTACDAQGNFEFVNIPDGAYFVIADVSWGVPTQYGIEPQGGKLMQRVAVSGGETQRVVLTRAGS